MRYFVLLIMILAASSVPARDLTLQQALDLAVLHSKQLRQSESTVRAAGRTVAATRAERLPTLSLDARASYISDIPALELNIPGLIDLSRDIGSKDTYQTDLRLSLPLYTGGRLSSAVAAARSNLAYAEATTAESRDQALLQARRDYFGLQRAEQLEKAAAASLRRATILRDEIQAGYSAGVADSVDLLEIELALTQAEFQLSQAEIGVARAGIELKSRLGLPADETIRPSDTLPDPVLAECARAVNTGAPGLSAARAGIAGAEANLSTARTGWLPIVAAYGGYSYGKPNNDFFSDQWTDYFTAGAQLQWSFNLGFSDARKTEAARAQVRAAEYRYTDLTETLDREIGLSLEMLRLSHTRYQTARRQYELTRDNFRLAQSRRDNGDLSANRLLEIESDLTGAEAMLASAKVDFYLAQSAYYYLVSANELGKGI